jgi:hypothetical protein
MNLEAPCKTRPVVNQGREASSVQAAATHEMRFRNGARHRPSAVDRAPARRARVRRAAVVAIVVIFAWYAPPGAAQNQEKYKVRLSTVPMDGGMREAVAGVGSASAVLMGTKLTITGTFQGLRSPATVARVHGGPARGVRGPALGELTVSKAVNGTITGSLDLTREQVQNLQNGRLYLQISSEKAPDGNLWGWLLR